MQIHLKSTEADTNTNNQDEDSEMLTEQNYKENEKILKLEEKINQIKILE